MFKIQLFCCFIAQLVKMLQLWSLYDVIEDTLPFVLNTKRPLSDIWLMRYKQNSFRCFQKNSEVKCFRKTPKTLLLITQRNKFTNRFFLLKTEIHMKILNIKWPLSDIWLLRYEQNNFGCFLRKLKF